MPDTAWEDIPEIPVVNATTQRFPVFPGAFSSTTKKAARKRGGLDNFEIAGNLRHVCHSLHFVDFLVTQAEFFVPDAVAGHYYNDHCKLKNKN